MVQPLRGWGVKGGLSLTPGSASFTGGYSNWATSWRKHDALSHTSWFIHLADVGVIRSADLRFRVGNLVAETSRDIAYLRFIHLADEGVIRSADLLFRVGNVVAETSRDIAYLRFIHLADEGGYSLR